MDGSRASKVLASGLVVAVLGGIFFGVAKIWGADPWVLTTGYSLMGAGGVMFAGGFVMLLLALQDPKGVLADDAGASFTALVRCMVAMSIADDDLDKREVKSISRIYEILTGEELEEEFVEEIARAMQEEKSDIQTELERIRDILTMDLKEKIIKASFYILAADGVVEKEGEQLLEEIRKGIDYPLVRFKVFKQRFLKKQREKATA
jgi:hypothetical protein